MLKATKMAAIIDTKAGTLSKTVIAKYPKYYATMTQQLLSNGLSPVD